jgi:hypothetical protein
MAVPQSCIVLFLVMTLATTYISEALRLPIRIDRSGWFKSRPCSATYGVMIKAGVGGQLHSSHCGLVS